MADPGSVGDRPPPYNYGAIPQQPGYAPPPPYPPQGQGMKGSPYAPQAPTTTTVVTQPQPVILSMVFGEAPASMVCGHCQAHIITCTSYENGTLTWLISGGLCIVGCWLGCCLIPFCVDGVKDVIHSCPNCHARLGVYRRM